MEKDNISSQLLSPRLEIASAVGWLTHMARKIKWKTKVGCFIQITIHFFGLFEIRR